MTRTASTKSWGLKMNELALLVRRLSDLERRVSGMVRHGTVEEVDTKTQRMKMLLMEDADGNKMVSDWMPYSQMAGAFKGHIPPSKGQQMTALSPSGDFQQAVGFPMTWSNENKSPGDTPETNILTFGKSTISISDGDVVISNGSVSMKISGGGVDINGGYVKHNGVVIDDTHEHTEVVTGGDLTGPPAGG